MLILAEKRDFRTGYEELQIYWIQVRPMKNSWILWQRQRDIELIKMMTSVKLTNG